MSEECNEKILSTSWHSYPSTFALGHSYLKDLLVGEVVIEEKVDGSQISFGRFGDELKIRSKGQQIFLDAPEKMFIPAIEYVKSIKDRLVDGWTYRGEYLARPKHNVLAYDRIPLNHIIIFDIETGTQCFVKYGTKKAYAAAIGLECVPLIYQGTLDSYEQFQSYLETISCLGGQKIEGVVIKNYQQFGKDKKILIGKFVSEDFKEVHKNEWKKVNPSPLDILDRIIFKYRTPARWNKAVQHLKEDGKLEGSPRDIGLLIKEVSDDILKECADDIVQELKDYAFPHLKRGFSKGIPEWYKQELSKQQFETNEAG